MAPLKALLALATSGLVPLAWAKSVHFDLNLTWQKGAPDGNAREMIFMNDQFPGPELRINQGDDVEFVVHNNMPFNTSIHFHGIEQHNTPWSDGVPGLTQKPIEPGRSWTYRWKATQYGTYFYHAHARSEMADGLYGAIWINPAPETLDPFHMISDNPTDIAAMKNAEKNPHLVILSDWDHLTAAEYQQAQRNSGLNIFCMDSVLINGRGAVYCPGTKNISSVELSYLKTAIGNQPLTDKGCLPNIYETQGDFPPTNEANVPQGLNAGCKPTTGLHEIITVNADHGWVSLKFISAASMKSLMFSIDEHPMYIYEVDGSYIEPQLADSVAIFNGERYAAMVKLDKPYKDYTIRVPDTQGDQVISGFATMRYQGSDNIYPSQPFVDYGGRSTSASVKALDQRSMKPYPPVTIPRHADQLVNLTLGRYGSSYTWTASGNALYDVMANWDDPILYDINAKNNLANQVTIQTKNGTWVDLLLQLGDMPHTSSIQTPHVMHKHSNKGFILGVGPGFFNWASTEEAYAARPELFQLDNPQRRDTFVTNGPAGPTWMIVRYQVVNPGPFLFHCHIETHLSNGMAVALLDGVDAWPQIPAGEDQSPGAGKGQPPHSSTLKPQSTPIPAPSVTPLYGPKPASNSTPQPPGYTPQPSYPPQPSYSPKPSYSPQPSPSSVAPQPPVTPSTAQATTTGDKVESDGHWHEPQHQHGVELKKVEVIDVIAQASDVPDTTTAKSYRRSGHYQARHW